MKTNRSTKSKENRKKSTYHHVYMYNPVSIAAFVIMTIILVYYVVAYFIIDTEIEWYKAVGLPVIYFWWLFWLGRATHIFRKIFDKLTGFDRD